MRYIYDREQGQMVEKDTGRPMLSQEERERPVQCPATFGDYEGYRSPVDGSWIEGRRARRYDLEKNNCIDANELSSKRERKFKNERFIKKHGLQRLSEQ